MKPQVRRLADLPPSDAWRENRVLSRGRAQSRRPKSNNLHTLEMRSARSLRERVHKLVKGVSLHEAHGRVNRAKKFDDDIECIAKEGHIRLRDADEQHEVHVMATPGNGDIVVQHRDERARSVGID